jgi:hypothetical protein
VEIEQQMIPARQEPSHPTPPSLTAGVGLHRLS